MALAAADAVHVRARWCKKCKAQFSALTCPAGHANFMYTTKLPYTAATTVASRPVASSATLEHTVNRGRTAAALRQPAASSGGASKEAHDDAEEGRQRWCKKCAAVFFGRKCPDGHPNFMYTTKLPELGESDSGLGSTNASVDTGGGGAPRLSARNMMTSQRIAADAADAADSPRTSGRNLLTARRIAADAAAARLEGGIGCMIDMPLRTVPTPNAPVSSRAQAVPTLAGSSGV